MTRPRLRIVQGGDMRPELEAAATRVERLTRALTAHRAMPAHSRARELELLTELNEASASCTACSSA